MGDLLMHFAIAMVCLYIYQLNTAFINILSAIINQLNWPIYVPPIWYIVFNMSISPRNTFREKLFNFQGFYLEREFNSFRLSYLQRVVPQY